MTSPSASSARIWNRPESSAECSANPLELQTARSNSARSSDRHPASARSPATQGGLLHAKLKGLRQSVHWKLRQLPLKRPSGPSRPHEAIPAHVAAGRDASFDLSGGLVFLFVADFFEVCINDTFVAHLASFTSS